MSVYSNFYMRHLTLGWNEFRNFVYFFSNYLYIYIYIYIYCEVDARRIDIVVNWYRKGDSERLKVRSDAQLNEDRDYVKLATLVTGDLMALFSIATTPRCRGGCYSNPWIDRLYPWSVPYNVKQVPFFESFLWLNVRLKPGLLDHWRTLYSLDQ